MLAKLPPILTETLTYPYTTGAFYVQSAQLAGGWSAVDDFYARMPESTEQILHPEKYAAKEGAGRRSASRRISPRSSGPAGPSR